MKAHELARELLSHPDIEVEVSVDMATDGVESTYGRRVFGQGLSCIQESFGMLTLLFETGDKNYEETE